MVKWLVRVSASIADRISGISSNPADDFALAERNICYYKKLGHCILQF